MQTTVAINRRKQARNRLFHTIFFFFSIILAVIFIFITIFFSIPTIYSYVVRKGYISPLASKFTTREALGNTTNEQTVKKGFEQAHYSVKSVEPFDEGYVITLETKEKIIISKQKPLQDQIASLQLISSRLTIEGKHFVQLDLRFDRPVLVSK